MRRRRKRRPRGDHDSAEGRRVFVHIQARRVPRADEYRRCGDEARRDRGNDREPRRVKRTRRGALLLQPTFELEIAELELRFFFLELRDARMGGFELIRKGPIPKLPRGAPSRNRVRVIPARQSRGASAQERYPPAMSSRTALLVGATGLVGGHCLDLLVSQPSYGRVVALTRRSLGRANASASSKANEVVVDFERLSEHADAVRADDVYCCLGTTRKIAGSDEAFRRVDHDYTVEVARIARQNGATRLALVSSAGADRNSRYLYPRVKGETERDVEALGYEVLEIFARVFSLAIAPSVDRAR